MFESCLYLHMMPLQIQLRDIPGFVDTRQQLLDLRPGNRNNWISFAVAHHLNKSHELAVQVLDAYDQMQVHTPLADQGHWCLALTYCWWWWLQLTLCSQYTTDLAELPHTAETLD